MQSHTKLVVFLFSVSILGFGDQQCHASDTNAKRSWIFQLLARVKTKKSNEESETIIFPGKNEHQTNFKKSIVEPSIVPIVTTPEFPQIFSFRDIKTHQRQTTTSIYPTTTRIPSVAIAVGAIAVAIAVALGTQVQSDETNERDIDIEPINITPLNNQTPINDLPMPVEGNDFPSDGCGDNSVRVANRSCFPVLTRGPCNNTLHWVTIDPTTLQGRCTPRLCGRGRVFVVRDGLCHDVYDPVECTGGRRLYYTSYGDPICDCPIGQYPFPNPHDNCIPLFTQGPCLDGYVVMITEQGRLGCAPTKCGSIGSENLWRQLVLAKDGVCYDLGSRGPCATLSQLLGYDIFKRHVQCIDILDPSTPYFSWAAQDDFIDSIYNQLHPEYDQHRVSLVYHSLMRENKTEQRRQGANTAGVLQFPSAPAESLLNPCRTGAREGVNYKCTNPLMPTVGARQLQQVVRPGLTTNCEGNAMFIAATGQCRARF